ncbi:MAG: type II toxin-antitoxin system VapC family toxin, partial [Jiangellaceae bacterium]
TRSEVRGPMPVVVDAGCFVEVALATPRGLRVADALSDAALFVPELFDVEVGSVLARLERAREITRDSADLAHNRLAAFPAQRISHEMLRDRAWNLRASLRIADAYYVSCCVAVSGSLITTDGRLARAPLPPIGVHLIR